MIALNSPLPSTVTMAMASSRAGKARNTSITRMIRVSTPRPKKPAMSPSSVPMIDRERDGREPRDQRDPGAVDDPAELVVAEAVDAEDVLGLVLGAAEQVDARRVARMDVLLVEQHLRRAVRGDDRREDGDEHEEAEDDRADDRRLLPERLPEGVTPQSAGPQDGGLDLGPGPIGRPGQLDLGLDRHQVTRTFGSRNV